MKDKENELFLIVLAIFDSFGSYPLPLNMYLNILVVIVVWMKFKLLFWV